MDTQKTRKVLIAMDGSEHSRVTFQWYLQNMRHEGDFVLLAWHVEPPPANYGTVNLMTGDPDLMSKIVHEQQIHEDHTLHMLEKKLQHANMEGRVLKLHGAKPGESIISAVTSEHVDMVIVGSRGMGTIRRTFLGSVSDYVLHHAHVPVIVCRTDGLHPH